MSDRIYSKLDTIFPVTGGGIGAITQISEFHKFFPAWETITITIILAVIGAVAGYLAKLLLDKICKKR